MFNIVKYWLDKGVDGFRLDVINTLYEDTTLRNNPRTWSLISIGDSDSWFFQKHEYDLNQPETIDFVLKLR